jgi:hypothetical protein
LAAETIFQQTNILYRILYRKLTIKFLSLSLFLILSEIIGAQVKNTTDTVKGNEKIIVKNPNDTIDKTSNSIHVDSADINKEKQSDIKSPIKYSAKDSMMFSVKNKMIYSYGDAQLGMDDMNLTAGHIRMNMDSNYVYATSMKDAEGKPIGEPVFKQGTDEYKEKALKYNFKTKKGIVYDVISEQGGGYLHARITKMHPNKEIHLLDGKFTTCDAEHPHFYLHLTKGKVIPDKKIISGPFNLVISDIPLPIGLPFGWFPIRKNKSSGFMLPSFTEEQRRGFGLEKGGYYLPVSDYMDMTLLGEIWTTGSWGVDILSNYRKRYKYSGSFAISYKEIIQSEKGLKDYSKSTTFWVKMSYAQDSKASPTSTFSSSLNFGSSKFRQFETTDINQATNNNTSSSIAYSKTFPNFNLSLSSSAAQNLSTHLLTLTLPTLTFNMTKKLKPFERKGTSGKKRWYEETQVGFSSGLSNTLNTADSLLFTKEALKKMSNGFYYNIPISTSIKLFKHLNLSPSFSYKGMVYTKYLEQQYHDRENIGVATKAAGYYADTISGLRHVYNFSFSAPISTKIYGMFQFKRGKIAAIRHVMSPTIGFGFTPDFGNERWGFYTKDKNDTTGRKLFSKYYGINGVPPTGKSGSIGFNLGNNLEMKLHSKDTTEKFKKIVLLNGLNFSTSYNIAADSLKWAPISISANTMLFKQISVSYSSILQLYTVDSTGQRQNITYMKKYGRLGQFNGHNISMSGSIGSETFKKKKKDTEQENTSTDESVPLNNILEQEDPFSKSRITDKDKKNQETKTDPDGYSFSLTWNISINYTFSSQNIFDKTTQRFHATTMQTLGLNGNLSLTSKWKISGSGSFDLEAKKLVNTNWSIFRDLHCWEMGFNFTPFGTWRSYSFRINVKSSMFQGLEYKKQKSFRDN